MKLLGVIVNFRTPAMTIDAVGALVRELRAIPGSRAVVVDNDSGDGSYEAISQAVRSRGWDDVAEVVRSERNGGFGYGNNFGIRRAFASGDPPEFVYLLNSDAFPDPGSVRTLLDYMEAHPEAGIAGSYIHGVDGRPHPTAFRYPNWVGELEAPLGIGWASWYLRRWVVALPIPKDVAQVDWLAGASMMIRRKVIEEVGLFDETFFLYFEETDLCRRARQAGWPTYYVPQSSVAHVGSASTGHQDLSRRTPTYYFDSRRWYFIKNHGRLYFWATNLVWILGYCIGHLRRKIMKRPDKVHRVRYFQDFLAYHFLPGARKSAPK